MFAAGQLQWEEEEVEELARDMMEGAAALGRHAEAGAIAAYHLSDPAAAVPHFCRAGHWREVLHLLMHLPVPETLFATVAASLCRLESLSSSFFRGV